MDLSSQRCNDCSNWLSSEKESIRAHPRLNLTLQHASLHSHFKQTPLSPSAAPMYVLPYLKYFSQCWQILEKGELEWSHNSYITLTLSTFFPIHYLMHFLSSVLDGSFSISYNLVISFLPNSSFLLFFKTILQQLQSPLPFPWLLLLQFTSLHSSKHLWKTLNTFSPGYLR